MMRLALKGPVLPLSLVAMSLMATACGQGKPPPQVEPPAAEPVAAAPGSAEPAENLITARSLLEAAMAEARKWQPDAELVVVTTSLADGPAHKFWFYDVQSRAAGRCTRIRAMASGMVTDAGPGDECVLMTPVATEFVDSPIAYDAAVSAGFKKGESVQLALSFKRDEALSEPRACWVIWSEPDGDETQGIVRGWCVDPVSGAFVTRLSGRGGSVPLR